MADNWVVPTSFSDPDTVWTDEAKAYDDDIETFAYTATISKYLELIIASIECDKVRIYVDAIGDPPNDPNINIDVYYSAGWHNIYSGTVGKNAWVEKEIGTQETVTKARIKYNNDVFTSFKIFEFNFNSVLSTVTTQDPTSVQPTTATANGNITQKGISSITVRGFKYGLTKVNTWDAHDNGDFAVGAYTKALTGLTGNTTYWIRAYVTDSEDTYYGDWVEFQTAASGTIPTGTNLFICADLSGYSFQLMRSETDDGETYTAYFVISTDLTNKQGLAYYKRILDLHLYFMSESSGTATIQVKRDSEASWQTVGTISLTGTEDIIVKHLAPDIRGKHFLFKISASNFFRFLGVLFEYLPEEMR